MLLSKYMQKIGVTQWEAAEKLGTSQQNISQICNGAIPRKELMLKILKWSRGAVKPNDFYLNNSRIFE